MESLIWLCISAIKLLCTSTMEHSSSPNSRREHMQAVDDEKETIHLYVVREEKPRPSLVPVLFSVVVLFLLMAIGVLFPYQQPEIRESLRVPAVLLPLKTFTTSVNVIPTGRKTHPATTAHGLLTITNGSILS